MAGLHIDPGVLLPPPELGWYTAGGGCMGGVPLSIGLMYEEPPGGDCRLDESDVPVETGEFPAVELVTPPPPVPPPLIVGDILLLLLTDTFTPPPDDFPDDLEPLLPEFPVELLFLDDAVLSVPVPL